MSKTVEINDTQVQNLVAELSEDKIQNIIFGALKKGGYVLKNNTLRTLRSKVNNTSSKSGERSIEEGVRMKGNKAYCEVNVNIMGDYRLIFLEKGTKIRKNSHGANRGQITARNFFADARTNDVAVYNAMDNQIEKSLNRIKR